jgi:hypothetical protein
MSKTRLPYLPLFIDDIETAERVRRMDNRAYGCYVRLLSSQWREGSVPADITGIADICCEARDDMTPLWEQIQRDIAGTDAAFIPLRNHEGRLRNNRLHFERQNARKLYRARVSAGRKGGQARWRQGLTTDSRAISTAIPIAMAPSKHTPSPSPTPTETEKQKETTSCTEPEKTPASVPEILKGLSLYESDPKLCKKLTPEVLDAWKKAYPGVDLAAQIAAAHAWEVGNPDRRKTNRVRFLTNWLNRAQDSPRPGPSRGQTFFPVKPQAGANYDQFTQKHGEGA